jgi:gamma-glutamyltranspeptidase/glutathione hydrolase
MADVVRAGIAAGHPATAQAGLEILDDGGSAADAAVAACLASCVAETVMTGLLGGGHAIYLSAARGTVRNLDCFVAVPSGSGGELEELAVPFGEELVHYAIGAASCAVPGIPAGLDALWRTHGRLSWPRLCEPAIALARAGVELPPAHASCLAMLAPVMTMREGDRIYRRDGSLLGAGDRLEQPGLVAALESLANEGPRAVYEGSIAEALLVLSDERGGRITGADLATYEARWSEPVSLHYAGTTFLTRGGLSAVPALLERFPTLRDLDETARVLALVEALDVPAPDGHTTNLVVVDEDGDACVLTTSLGLGSGDWLPGLDLHLNSMLGERDLVRGHLVPGERMESMMAPSIARDDDGLMLAIGAAGGTRLGTALVTVAAGILDEGLEPQAAVERPRVHPAGATVNAEPGVDERALDELEARGRPVRRWPALHHYFGGVSAIGRAGSGADPRRSGAALARPSRGRRADTTP